MGVRIHSYGKVEKVPAPEDPDWTDSVELFSHEEFAHALEGLEVERRQTQHHLWLTAGWFAVSEPGPSLSLSYTGYNILREKISRAAMGAETETVWRNPAEYESKPFWGLVNFSDCEGGFSPEAAARVAANFREHPNLLVSSAGDYWNYQESYERLASVFEHAAGRGVVIFS